MARKEAKVFEKYILNNDTIIGCNPSDLAEQLEDKDLITNDTASKIISDSKTDPEVQVTTLLKFVHSQLISSSQEQAEQYFNAFIEVLDDLGDKSLEDLGSKMEMECYWESESDPGPVLLSGAVPGSPEIMKPEKLDHPPADPPGN